MIMISKVVSKFGSYYVARNYLERAMLGEEVRNQILNTLNSRSEQDRILTSKNALLETLVLIT